jgi:hypothetical protein
VGGPVVGFGAQYNSYLFSPTSRFKQSKVDEHATLLNKLRPQHVRIFFARAFRSADYKTSFSRTVGLAQSWRDHQRDLLARPYEGRRAPPSSARPR